ncbi:MAG TPA: hypothetical protein VK358_11195 [Longimicrobium sp.]|nr:hypothetical protein [Longimicrobium sp.]
MAVQGLFVLNLEAWFFGVLALLHGMAFAARLRLRLHPRHGAAMQHPRRVWLASRESVRLRHMLLLGSVLIGVAMAGGAAARRHWLAEAQSVFAATMSAARAGRPLPAGVEFTMHERWGNEFVNANPVGRFAVDIDPRIAGDRFLDRFVAPYAYGGLLLFDSGKQFEFTVYRDPGMDGWGVFLDAPGALRERW